MEEQNAQKSQKKLLLVNATEELVKLRVRDTIKQLGGCPCETCYLNACAIALNALPPRYVTTTMGAVLEEVSGMQIVNQTTILVEVTKAVMQVMERPRH